MRNLLKIYFGLFFTLTTLVTNLSCRTTQPTGSEPEVLLVKVGEGWANNSVNVVPFRKNALVTYRDNQFIAYYNSVQQVVLGKRKLGEEAWELHTTPYKGNAADAHNSISIAVDGDGFLHVSWDHHNNVLRYAKSKAPLSLELGEKQSMTGSVENTVSYPEFYSIANGNLLFLYRDGGSGRGNLVINRYDKTTKTWTQLHRSLIDGEGQRNAYWQAATDNEGNIHISWVWRESPDVASNHDLCYARSKDGGLTWERSTGEAYTLPVTAATAEYAVHIPQKSELINQTSMTTDKAGNPFIATYWREPGSQVPTYHVVYRDNNKWQTANLATRQTPFSLSGMGSKRIPIARPQLVVSGTGGDSFVGVIYRDEERGSKVSVATVDKIRNKHWQLKDLTQFSVGSWEPMLDPVQWEQKKQLHLFVQAVEQVDGEGRANIPPQMVYVLEWNPKL
ncbi:BNR-4 repeat-containing protein [Flavisolibacter sp. BT320]|nr:BNR-4 repeat-containing protein [Flavisolibacter longurius]